MKTCTHCARTLSYTDRHGGCPFCGLDSVVERAGAVGQPVALFEIGDVVRLRSGGPSMTVVAMEYDFGENEFEVGCSWFDGRTLHSKRYPTSQLERTMPDDPATDPADISGPEIGEWRGVYPLAGGFSYKLDDATPVEKPAADAVVAEPDEQWLCDKCNRWVPMGATCCCTREVSAGALARVRPEVQAWPMSPEAVQTRRAQLSAEFYKAYDRGDYGLLSEVVARLRALAASEACAEAQGGEVEYELNAWAKARRTRDGR